MKEHEVAQKPNLIISSIILAHITVEEDQGAEALYLSAS